MSSEHITPEDLHLAQWQDRLQDALDGALTALELSQVNAHLATCVLCTTEQQHLLAIDAQLRSEFANAKTPAANFDQRLFQRIATLEQDRIATARQREQQAYAARLAQMRYNWRKLARFHLGNIVGVAAIIGAIAAAIGSMWPTASQRLEQVTSVLPQGYGLSTLSVAIVIVSVGVAATTMWLIKGSASHNTF